MRRADRTALVGSITPILSKSPYSPVTIAYATHIKSEGFQRFSIAHELGHYFLEGHPDAVFKSGDIHESRAGFGSADQIELEADHFAAGLLMPSHLFAAAAGRYSDGLEAIKGLAADSKTSLTASAIRYAELTDAAIALPYLKRLSVPPEPHGLLGA
jgi:Zn-dependent peptidase ImmA (M78 family)